MYAAENDHCLATVMQQTAVIITTVLIANVMLQANQTMHLMNCLATLHFGMMHPDHSQN